MRTTAATVVNTGQLIVLRNVDLLLVDRRPIVSPLTVAKIVVALVLVFFAVFVGLLKMGAW